MTDLTFACAAARDAAAAGHGDEGYWRYLDDVRSDSTAISSRTAS